MIKSTGPHTEPCGTPYESVTLKTHNYALLQINLINQTHNLEWVNIKVR